MGKGRRLGTRTTFGGVNYRSKFEVSVAADLARRGIEFSYESKRLFYELPCVYTPDFVIGNMIVECKGFFAPEDRRKMLEVKKSNPDLDLRMLFMRDTKLSTGPRPLRCSTWCIKHGFPYAIGAIPESWLESDDG